MKRREFPDKVLEWIDAVEAIAAPNPEIALEYCDKLEKYADEVQSDYIKGYGLFYKGYCYYCLNELESGIEHLSAALNCLIPAEEWNLTARTYNALGNIADFQGDLSLAIDYFFKGLACCHEHDLEVTTYYLESNIANIYISLGEPLNAVPRLLRCEKLIKKGLPFSSNMRTIVYANLTNCYIQLNNLETAEKYLAKLEAESAEDNSLVNRISVLYLRAALFNGKNELKTRDEAIEEFQKIELTSIVVFDALNELCSHAMTLLEIEKYEAFCELVDQIDSLANTANVRKKTLRLRLKYYKKIGDEENYAKMAVRYYEVSESQEDQQNKIISHNILTRSYLDEEAARRKEIEKTNLMLKRKSEKDALTGMNNRYKLNELSELAFHKAYMNGSPLSVELLDIDCYKEYNDNYGHQAGDDCLIKIAEVIRSMEEYTGVYTGRYGGDEFMLIYEDYTKEDVQEMAERLRTKIRNLNIEHKYSRVDDRITVSQGIFHKIPVGNNKLWDFLYAADMALYAVKKSSRDSFYVANSLKEIKSFTQTIDDK